MVSFAIRFLMSYHHNMEWKNFVLLLVAVITFTATLVLISGIVQNHDYYLMISLELTQPKKEPVMEMAMPKLKRSCDTNMDILAKKGEANLQVFVIEREEKEQRPLMNSLQYPHNWCTAFSSVVTKLLLGTNVVLQWVKPLRVHCHPRWILICVQAVLLPTQLTANGLGKAVKNEPSHSCRRTRSLQLLNSACLVLPVAAILGVQR